VIAATIWAGFVTAIWPERTRQCLRSENNDTIKQGAGTAVMAETFGHTVVSAAYHPAWARGELNTSATAMQDGSSGISLSFKIAIGAPAFRLVGNL
jgi:hypothetical protein